MKTRFNKALGNFAANIHGSTATMFALALIPAMVGSGAALDYGNALRVQAQMQSVADSAALAGATERKNGGTEANSRAIVETFVAGKLSSASGAPPVVTTTFPTADRVSVRVDLNLPTTIMQIVGINTMALAVNAGTSFGTETIEVAIALDTTGSMAPNSKLADAKIAAVNLINTIVGPSGTNPRVKFALVPFHHYVNVGVAYKHANWISNSEDLTVPYSGACYNTYPDAVYGTPIVHNYTADGVPMTWTEWPVISYGTPVEVCYPNGVNHYYWNGVVGSRSYPSDLQADVSPSNKVPAVWWVEAPGQLVRLNNDPAPVIAQINALNPSGETYIAPGLLWAWRALSPNPPFSDGAAYSSNTKKIVILMTDGANTKSASYPNNDGSNVADANSVTASTCANMKATGVGITIYTIAFLVTDPTIQGILENCATTPGHYYNATSNAAMLAAFAQIAANLTMVRLNN